MRFVPSRRRRQLGKVQYDRIRKIRNPNEFDFVNTQPNLMHYSELKHKVMPEDFGSG